MAAVALVLAAVVALDAIRSGDDAPSTVTAAGAATPVEAVGDWLVDHRDELFPGSTIPYIGTCPTDAPGLVTGLCSNLREDLGDHQIHLVGAYATDWGADVLLERDGGSWSVIASSPWPELGTRYDGPPWSPSTAITTWWFDRAAERFGEGAVHLRSCAEAGAVADTAQPLLCSTLVADDGDERTYDSGLVGADPVVRIVLAREADHTWTVTATRPAP